MKNCVLLGMLAVLCVHAGAARAQTSVFKTPTPCQGGTGSPLTAVGTSATLVCSASTGQRQYWRVTANSGTYGNIALVCTDDGTTPTSSHYNWPVYTQLGTDSTGQTVISPAAIQCLSLSGTVTISASAIQAGVP